MTWVTVEYAADLMGVHPRSVHRACRDGRYRVRRVPGRHSGKERTEIEVRTLPSVAQERWLAATKVVRMPTAAAPAPDDAASSALGEERLAWARYRYRIIEPLLTGAWARAGISKGEFIEQLAAAEYSKPNGKPERYSASGIYRMLRRFQDGGLSALANDERSDRGTTKMSQPLQDFVLAAYCSGGSEQRPALRSIREVERLVADERTKRAALIATGQMLDYLVERDFRTFLIDDEPAPPDFYQFPEVSYGTIRRFCEAIPQPFKVLSRLGLKAYQDHCEKTTTRDYLSIKPMEYVVFDHRRSDIFVMLKRRGRWALIRPWETVAMDMRTRKVLACVQCEVPSALSVASCIRQVILGHGLFEFAYLDNGKEFTAQYIDGAGAAREGETWCQDFGAAEFDATRGILKQLGIGVVHALPYGARSKSIEPSFRNPAAYERTLAGACGNRTPNRPEWLAGWEQDFARWVAGKIEVLDHPFHQWDDFRDLKKWFYFEDYNRRAHSGRGMDGRAPEEFMRTEYLERGLARMVNPRQLDLLMQKRKVRRVQNGGTFVIAWGGQDFVYSAPELFLHQGDDLETGYDPYEVSELTVFDAGGQYLTTARCEPLRGMGEREFTEDIKARRRALKQTKEAIAQIGRYATVPTARERVEWSRVLAGAAAAADPATPAAADTYLRDLAAAGPKIVAVRPAPAALPAVHEKEEEPLQFLGS